MLSGIRVRVRALVHLLASFHVEILHLTRISHRHCRRIQSDPVDSRDVGVNHRIVTCTPHDEIPFKLYLCGRVRFCVEMELNTKEIVIFSSQTTHLHSRTRGEFST